MLCLIQRLLISIRKQASDDAKSYDLSLDQNLYNFSLISHCSTQHSPSHLFSESRDITIDLRTSTIFHSNGRTF